MNCPNILFPGFLPFASLSNSVLLIFHLRIVNQGTAEILNFARS